MIVKFNDVIALACIIVKISLSANNACIIILLLW